MSADNDYWRESALQWALKDFEVRMWSIAACLTVCCILLEGKEVRPVFAAEPKP